jgi:hypothetical protein
VTDWEHARGSASGNPSEGAGRRGMGGSAEVEKRARQREMNRVVQARVRKRHKVCPVRSKFPSCHVRVDCDLAALERPNKQNRPRVADENSTLGGEGSAGSGSDSNADRALASVASGAMCNSQQAPALRHSWQAQCVASTGPAQQCAELTDAPACNPASCRALRCRECKLCAAVAAVEIAQAGPEVSGQGPRCALRGAPHNQHLLPLLFHVPQRPLQVSAPFQRTAQQQLRVFPQRHLLVQYGGGQTLVRATERDLLLFPLSVPASDAILQRWSILCGVLPCSLASLHCEQNREPVPGGSAAAAAASTAAAAAAVAAACSLRRRPSRSWCSIAVARAGHPRLLAAACSGDSDWCQ